MEPELVADSKRFPVSGATASGQLCFFRGNLEGTYESRAETAGSLHDHSVFLPFGRFGRFPLETLRVLTGHLDGGLRGPTSLLLDGLCDPVRLVRWERKWVLSAAPAPACHLGKRTVGVAAWTQTQKPCIKGTELSRRPTRSL